MYSYRQLHFMGEPQVKPIYEHFVVVGLATPSSFMQSEQYFLHADGYWREGSAPLDGVTCLFATREAALWKLVESRFSERLARPPRRRPGYLRVVTPDYVHVA